jgi:ribosomal protein L19
LTGNRREPMAKGIVYILTNPSLDGWVKIGKTDKDDIQERLDNLNNSTSIPLDFRPYALYHVENPLQVEGSIQGIIDLINPKLRAIEVKENGKLKKKEFYRISPDQAFAIFKKFAQGRGDERSLELISPTSEDIKIESLLKGRRPNLNFYELGLKDNFELAFKQNPQIVVKIVSEKQVEYEGEQYFLTALTRKLLGWQTDRKPAPYWLYEGKSLSDIYEEKYT